MRDAAAAEIALKHFSGAAEETTQDIQANSITFCYDKAQKIN